MKIATSKILKIFDLKNFGRPISKYSIFFVINRFGRFFIQNCVDFHGGDDGIEIHAI